MSGIFLAAFLAGLGLAIYAMIRGVERSDPARPPSDALGRELASTRIAWWLPAAAGGLVSFGAGSYLAHRLATLSPAALIPLGLLCGAAGAVGAHMLVSRWAVPAAAREPEDPRFALQGHPARVLRPIASNGTGEISYEANGRRVVT